MERLTKKDRDYKLTMAVALSFLVIDIGAIVWRGELLSAGFFALIAAVGLYNVRQIRALHPEAGKLAADLLVAVAFVGALSLGG